MSNRISEELDFEIEKKQIVARTRKLKARWHIEPFGYWCSKCNTFTSDKENELCPECKKKQLLRDLRKV